MPRHNACCGQASCCEQASCCGQAVPGCRCRRAWGLLNRRPLLGAPGVGPQQVFPRRVLDQVTHQPRLQVWLGRDSGAEEEEVLEGL